MADGKLVPASIRELRAHFSLVFNSPFKFPSLASKSTFGGVDHSAHVPVVYLSICCEQTIGHLTYPSSQPKHNDQGLETATPVVMYEDDSGLLVETSPSVFESQRANCIAKKWRGSFKAIGEQRDVRILLPILN